MGNLLWAIALIIFIGVLSKIRFKTKRVCPKCSQKIKVINGKCANCGYIFPNEDLDDDNDEDTEE